MNGPEKRPAWFVLTQNWISLVGIFLVTTAGISWLFVLPLQIRGHVNNPYIGIIVFLILPIIFFPNNLGHTDFPGCFRCHDGSHTTADNVSITQDCNTCHEPLAMEETSPEILKSLGISERISNLQKQ
jgi:hypothetical protein